MIDVEIEGEGWGAHGLNLEALSATAAMAVLQHRQIEGGVTILLTDNDELTELNLRFRNLDKPTNVLAFPAGENPENHLGDIAVAYGVCAAEAELEGKSLNHHLQHLVTHGVLHLLDVRGCRSDLAFFVGPVPCAVCAYDQPPHDPPSERLSNVNSTRDADALDP